MGTNQQVKYSVQMLIGNGVAQLLTLVATIILTKYYVPEIYGEYSLIILLIFISLPLSSQRFELVSLSTSNIEIRQLTRNAVIRTIIYSLAVGLFTFVSFHNYWDFSLEVSLLNSILAMMAKALANIVSIFSGLNLRNRKFLRIVISGILQNTFTLIMQIYLSKYVQSCSMLLVGFIIGRGVAIMVLYRHESFNIVRYENAGELQKKRLTSETSNKQKFLIRSSLIDNLNASLPYLYVLLLGSKNDFGLFAIALNLVQSPAFLIISAISTPQFVIKYQTLNPKLNQNHKLKTLSRKSFTKNTLLASICFYILILILSQAIVPILSNLNWSESISIVKFIAIPISVQILASSLLNAKIAEGNWKLAWQASTFSLICSFLLGSVGYLCFDRIEAAVSLSLFGRSIGIFFALCLVEKTNLLRG